MEKGLRDNAHTRHVGLIEIGAIAREHRERTF